MCISILSFGTEFLSHCMVEMSNMFTSVVKLNNLDILSSRLRHCKCKCKKTTSALHGYPTPNNAQFQNILTKFHGFLTAVP
ncbi:hypothetical protein VNO77_34988 [Canavalia gladiata]|uniref:Uncharacterized protein n=1 Tax=Canavalia gladiata TaxID=3824 RepID=A0AAN9KE82_CANGL